MESVLVIPVVVALTVSALVVWSCRVRATGPRRGQWQKVGLAALAAFAYSALQLVNDVNPQPTPQLLGWLGRAQLAIAAAWVYVATALHVPSPLRPRTRWQLAVTGLLAAGAAAALVPGVFLPDSLLDVRVASLALTVHVGTATPAGAGFAVLLVSAVVVLWVRALWRWHQGEPGAPAAAIALGLLVLGGINDTLLMVGGVSTLPMLSVGFAAHGLTAVLAMVHDEVAAVGALERLARELEEKVATRSAELARAREEFVRNEKLAALGRLSAGVAHEINNPAGIALASLQYLERELAGGLAAPADATEALADGVAAIERITRIVRQLQESGRSASAAPPDLQPVAVREVVEHALGLAASTRSATVEVANDVPADTWVVGQSRLLRQALLNLLLNAQVAAGDGGREGKVRVFAQRSAGRITLLLEDDGPGVPEPLTGNLFEPFFSTRGVGEGMGLGLAVARNLVQAMRGELTLASSRPGRTVFTLTLDAVDGPALPAPRPTPFPARGRPQVLVIDDDALVRRAIARQLGATYEVCTVETVAGALELIEAQPARFSAVLCDVMMPDGGARTFLPEIRKRWPALESRTLFITGGTTTAAADQFFDLHFEQVLQKPLDTRKLLAALAERVGIPLAEPAPADASKGRAQ